MFRKHNFWLALLRLVCPLIRPFVVSADVVQTFEDELLWVMCELPRRRRKHQTADLQ
jgi:hypothetical protein